MFETGSYKFEVPKQSVTRSIIKVIGVGGGGSNAVNHMYKQGIKDVEFVVCNTDNQALLGSPVPNKLQIGTNLTEGLGCGANPEVGKNAALESKEQIREMLTGTKMVFVTAGMGGGTGTGAAPVIAKIAKDMDILTVGIVTAPFMFEGKKKMNQAELGIDALRANCDTVLVILNDKLREIFGNLSINQAFAQADNILTTAAKGIAEIITLAGYVNVDFQDVRTVMLNAGAAVMGSAETRGEDRAKKAAEGALSSPLLDNRDIMGAKKILLSIISGVEAELQMDELSEITEYIQEQAGDEAEMIFGHGVDPDLGDRIRVTVIATGFQSSELKENATAAKKKEEKKIHDLDRSQGWLFNSNADHTVNNTVNESQRDIELRRRIEEETRKQQQNDQKSSEREVHFSGPFNRTEQQQPVNTDDDGEEGLFRDDEFDVTSNYGDQTINDDGMMELRSTKQRLQQQAEERKEKLKKARKGEMTKDEFNEKWSLPAYLRRGVKMNDVPHSSEQFISKYNLNDDNNLLGNNKFLHDNVD
ncbi:cell division protein FtsZ [Pseudochryseolinea flava]|uniref:Cell division protein FtsZ n=1 Tax=Pseudochryseolinea flava TaxID=2059302 RepID=A0A364XW51_9BACT|nr:cell division protein FtsZ [Pseudochryseolinea flava]RAV98361.1 cell division protein FtsZ [Pseudochryseolinea flava]